MKMLKIIALSSLVFFALTEPCYANPIGVSPLYQISWWAFIIILIVAPFVETRIIVNRVSGVKRDKSLPSWFPWSVFLMNIVTVIATQFLAYYIDTWSRAAALGTNALGYLAEVLPLTIEYVLLRWLLTTYYNKGILAKPYSNKVVARITVLANLVTFVGGLVFLLALNYSRGLGLTPWPW